MKKWETLNKLKFKSSNFKVDALIDLLLENRGVKTAKEREDFLHPKFEIVTPESVGIDLRQLKKALKRIKKAIGDKEQIVVFGDYDVDGITGAAILWETIHRLGAKVMPYIPHRVDEGYGLSLKALEGEELRALNPKLIITVDNGIVAHDAVEFANQQGIDVIITDHHAVGDKVPDALAIVHTTKLCGAGVAYVLMKELIANCELRIANSVEDTHLELAALGTVADMVPLTGANRTIVKYGLEALGKTKRHGLLALFRQAKLEKEKYGVYDIGFVIAPRLNAAGRIESAMDSLRLLCTLDPNRAEILAENLELTNRERQILMKAAVEHAKAGVRGKGLGARKLLFVADESYPQGVIGLVAGKLVEEFYLPSIVLSIGEKYSKASVRSVSGFNIVEFLRNSFDEFINIGGHPMAAGFTIETAKIQLLQEKLEGLAEDAIRDDVLTRRLKIDCELPLGSITQDLYESIQQLSPFGMGNPEPAFVSRGVVVKDIRAIGKESNHLKLQLQHVNSQLFDAIAFGFGEFASKIKKGDAIDVVYVIDENTWNGNTKLQLKIKDISFKH